MSPVRRSLLWSVVGLAFMVPALASELLLRGRFLALELPGIALASVCFVFVGLVNTGKYADRLCPRPLGFLIGVLVGQALLWPAGWWTRARVVSAAAPVVEEAQAHVAEHGVAPDFLDLEAPMEWWSVGESWMVTYTLNSSDKLRCDLGHWSRHSRFHR